MFDGETAPYPLATLHFVIQAHEVARAIGTGPADWNPGGRLDWLPDWNLAGRLDWPPDWTRLPDRGSVADDLRERRRQVFGDCLSVVFGESASQRAQHGGKSAPCLPNVAQPRTHLDGRKNRVFFHGPIAMHRMYPTT
jgi:hypothetical protein